MRAGRVVGWVAVAIGPLVGSAIAGPLGGPVPSASASASASSAKVEFAVLTGTKSSVSAIPSGHPGLGQPPWTMYPHYTVSSAKPLVLVVGKTVQEPLANGQVVKLTLMTAGAKPHVDVVLASASGSASAKASVTLPGKWAYPFHVPHAGGGLVVGVKP